MAIVDPHVYRIGFLLVVLVLTFLLFPATRRQRSRLVGLDWTLVAAAVAALGWPLADFDEFPYRAATLLPIDVLMGAVTILLVLEATRRTVGWVLPVTAILFILYATLGAAAGLIAEPPPASSSGSSR